MKFYIYVLYMIMECKLNTLTGYYSPMVLFITRPLRDSVTNGDRARITCNIILIMTYMILLMLEKQ